MFCHGSQEMACGRTRWVGPHHTRTATATAVSSMALGIAAVPSRCRTESASPAAQAKTCCCEDVRHMSVWRHPSEGRGSRRTGDTVGICARCRGSGSRPSQAREKGFCRWTCRSHSARVSCPEPAHLTELEAKRGRCLCQHSRSCTEVGGMKGATTAVCSPLDAESELRQLRA